MSERARSSAAWRRGAAFAGVVSLLACAAPARFTEPLSGMALVLVPAGEFGMGSPEGEPGREAQEILHRVRISRPFYLGATEVTQEQWRRVMDDSPAAFAECGGDCPVESVSALEVDEFLRRLSLRTGRPFRLPTEAEWEYACRAGTATPFSFGDELDAADAAFDAAPELPARRSPLPVASFAANAFGLHDLHGNVWEWTADPHCPYVAEAAVDPRGDCVSELRVIRGGSWHYGPDSARCALRYTHRPEDSGWSLGFRVALDAGAAR
jgi:formylglycine-generating enzyme required for sulfatase activity